MAGRLRAGSKPGKTRKPELGLDRSKGKTTSRYEQTKRTGNRQTENTGINTQGIMGKMGDTWRRVETSTKTGETDQGVTGRHRTEYTPSKEKSPKQQTEHIHYFLI